MKAQTKRDWIAALRSGEYQQGRGRLHDHQGRMCCLGVLADVAYDGDWEEMPGEGWKIGDCVGTLHGRIANDIGVSIAVNAKCMSLNDVENKSFAEIADWIEENV